MPRTNHPHTDKDGKPLQWYDLPTDSDEDSLSDWGDSEPECMEHGPTPSPPVDASGDPGRGHEPLGPQDTNSDVCSDERPSSPRGGAACPSSPLGGRVGVQMRSPLVQGDPLPSCSGVSGRGPPSPYGSGGPGRCPEGALTDASTRTCDLCDKTYSGRSAKRSLRRHMLNVHIGRRWMCQTCGQCYRRRIDLMSHQAKVEHEGESVETYPPRCPAPPGGIPSLLDLQVSPPPKRRRVILSCAAAPLEAPLSPADAPPRSPTPTPSDGEVELGFRLTPPNSPGPDVVGGTPPHSPRRVFLLSRGGIPVATGLLPDAPSTSRQEVEGETGSRGPCEASTSSPGSARVVVLRGDTEGSSSVPAPVVELSEDSDSDEPGLVIDESPPQVGLQGNLASPGTPPLSGSSSPGASDTPPASVPEDIQLPPPLVGAQARMLLPVMQRDGSARTRGDFVPEVPAVRRARQPDPAESLVVLHLRAEDAEAREGVLRLDAAMEAARQLEEMSVVAATCRLRTRARHEARAAEAAADSGIESPPLSP